MNLYLLFYYEEFVIKLKQKITKINDKIAMNVTVVFGTMWTIYLFFLYGLLPVFFHNIWINYYLKDDEDEGSEI